MNAEFEIQLRDVLLYAHHGVLHEESVLGNQYRVNVRIRIDASCFDIETSDLSSTISYADLFDIVKAEMSVPTPLLETVAVRIALSAKKTWVGIKSGEIEIVKIVPPIPGMIGEAGVCYKF